MNYQYWLALATLLLSIYATMSCVFNFALLKWHRRLQEETKLMYEAAVELKEKAERDHALSNALNAKSRKAVTLAEQLVREHLQE